MGISVVQIASDLKPIPPPIYIPCLSLSFQSKSQALYFHEVLKKRLPHTVHDRVAIFLMAVVDEL